MIDLYRFFDASERLLYIGISLSAIQRANEHRKEKPWWPEVARMHVTHLEASRLEAEAIERQAIIDERPIHNVKHNGTASPDRAIIKEQCEMNASRDPLVGMFVLTPDEDAGWPLASHQGIVEAMVGDFVLVRWFSWWDGQPNFADLVRLETMVGWRFYNDNDEFVDVANKASKARDQKMKQEDRKVS